MSEFDRNWIKDGWEKLCTNKQTNRHYENNGHLAVNQQRRKNNLLGAGNKEEKLKKDVLRKIITKMTAESRPLMVTGGGTSKTSQPCWLKCSQPTGTSLIFRQGRAGFTSRTPGSTSAHSDNTGITKRPALNAVWFNDHSTSEPRWRSFFFK